MKNKIIGVLCAIIIVLLITTVYYGQKSMQDTNKEVCLVPNEVAEQYMINCQTVNIESEIYTLCQQNIKED